MNKEKLKNISDLLYRMLCVRSALTASFIDLAGSKILIKRMEGVSHNVTTFGFIKDFIEKFPEDRDNWWGVIHTVARFPDDCLLDLISTEALDEVFAHVGVTNVALVEITSNYGFELDGSYSIKFEYFDKFGQGKAYRMPFQGMGGGQK